MGTEVEKKPEPARVKDATKPWRRQFFKCEEKPEPAFNKAGFWRPVEHGIPVNKGV